MKVLAMSRELTPDLNPNVGDRLAGGNVENVNVDPEGNTVLLLSYILADELASYICKSHG